MIHRHMRGMRMALGWCAQGSQGVCTMSASTDLAGHELRAAAQTEPPTASVCRCPPPSVKVSVPPVCSRPSAAWDSRHRVGAGTVLSVHAMVHCKTSTLA
eukprot:scaffold12785_cov84-Phaeocystis_antarctica.AAC.2